MPPKFKPVTPDAFGIDTNVFKKPDSILLQEDIEFLDTPELAKALEVPENIIRQMIGRRAITFYRISGKILFRRTDVLAYLDNKEERSTDQPTIPTHATITCSPGKGSWRERDSFDTLCDLIGYELERSSKDDPSVGWALLQGRDGKILLTQRRYRDGIGFIRNPSDEALERYRTNPWLAWNEARVLRF